MSDLWGENSEKSGTLRALTMVTWGLPLWLGEMRCWSCAGWQGAGKEPSALLANKWTVSSSLWGHLLTQVGVMHVYLFPRGEVMLPIWFSVHSAPEESFPLGLIENLSASHSLGLRVPHGSPHSATVSLAVMSIALLSWEVLVPQCELEGYRVGWKDEELKVLLWIVGEIGDGLCSLFSFITLFEVNIFVYFILCL